MAPLENHQPHPKKKLNLRIYGNEIVEERYESTQGRVVTGLFKMADLHGKEMISSAMITECLLCTKHMPC